MSGTFWHVPFIRIRTRHRVSILGQPASNKLEIWSNVWNVAKCLGLAIGWQFTTDRQVDLIHGTNSVSGGGFRNCYGWSIPVACSVAWLGWAPKIEAANATRKRENSVLTDMTARVSFYPLILLKIWFLPYVQRTVIKRSYVISWLHSYLRLFATLKSHKFHMELIYWHPFIKYNRFDFTITDIFVHVLISGEFHFVVRILTFIQLYFYSSADLYFCRFLFSAPLIAIKLH